MEKKKVSILEKNSMTDNQATSPIKEESKKPDSYDEEYEIEESYSFSNS
jgi:hypothetical protein